MEAFFWVFVFLCITRGGPGGNHREELQPSSLPTLETEKLLLDHLFYSDDINALAENKARLFLEDDFEGFVLPHIHSYFEPLKPLLVRWWKVLRIAHQFPMFEAVHDWFLDALRDTIHALKEHPHEIHPETERVNQSRWEDLRSLQYFPG